MSKGVASRRLAADALQRIENEGAYANIALGAMLAKSELDQRDRAFVTELVYGTTRMRRALDWIVDRFLAEPERTDDVARRWLRLGAYQLVFMAMPPHAAVSATIDAAPRKISGFLNAILRKVSSSLPITWPSDEIRLSQPDWIVAILKDDLGEAVALDALAAMNERAQVHRRDDGYIQDDGSHYVVDIVGAKSGERILDLCAAPGGKATGMAQAGAFVVAADSRASRVNLIEQNRQTLQLQNSLSPMVSDGCAVPLRPSSFDKVLVDAPCSGLGSLRRRPDARWRIAAESVASLAALQKELLANAATLVRPGGELFYSVCTLTKAETTDVALWAQENLGLKVVDFEHPAFTPAAIGRLCLPAETDGMYLVRFVRQNSDNG
ncbi:MAG: hypothetical protein RLZZ31_703 [Actinomycetota bacterium]